MISLNVFVYNAFQENTFVVSDETKRCLIIDPGMNSDYERKEISDFITSKGLRPEAIVNTHGHIDHILGCNFIKTKYQVPFYIHSADNNLLNEAEEYGAFFGLEVDAPSAADHFLNDGQEFRFGGSVLHLLHVPGHSKGSIAFYSQADKFVITGDALFNGSIGRTDLPGGDYQTLIQSIKSKLMSLPRDVAVYPGHGPSTTVGKEYDTNPFLK